ncbi:hypothetical protein WMY93_007168 [Mugilogobius chulae]|uniref:Glutamate--cysteine ligase n=1 Tax=Mugilogobius chulae TaxID=88201 RepID=A0AAW0PLZ7_9GOBI
MGLLSQGSPLNWEETKKYADHIRKHGIIQFLNIYNKVEYMLMEWDDKDEKVRLVLRTAEVLEALQEQGEKINPNHPTLWRPEYGSYMIEGHQGSHNETLATVTAFPRLGCPGFTRPEHAPTPVEKGVSKSLFFPDQAINVHPRFSTLTRNIRHRRGEKVVINVPIFKDKCTPSPFVEKFPEDDGEAARAALPDHIYMDAMGFGMGNCCLQVTFQACSIDEARYLYDQLTTFCPIVMALSAASPFYRGYVSDIDCRWGVISASVDDRTEEERGLKNIQSTNWQSMRFKPPPPNSEIGWRVEFRPMEVQLTDFENAAYVVFVVLLTRVILSYKLDFLIPLSKEGVFQGLIPILNCYLENMEVDVDTRCTILNYLKLIKKRASGELMTMAKWMREFVANHPQYKQDSVITDKINYDLMRKCDRIAKGEEQCPELFGNPLNKVK